VSSVRVPLDAVTRKTGRDILMSRPGSAGLVTADEGVSLRSAMDLEVLIPAYNEAERLPATLRRTVEFLTTQAWRSRVVVIDNGSVDETAAVAREAVRPVGRVEVTVIGCSIPGKGAAVRRGALTSTSTFVGFLDADLATPIETLAATMLHLRQGATAVIASRHAPGARLVRPQPVSRGIGGAAFRRLTRHMVVGVHDTQCGFKFFERAAAQRAIRDTRLTGFAFDVELLANIQRAGGTIVELPVAWTDQAGSTFRPVRDGVSSFAGVLALWAGSR
jgi:dolichyl-phosphate beta-glucosyltransferase